MTVVNAAQLIAFSEAVPFKCRQNTYLCFYCGMECDDADLLRSHTKTHPATDREIQFSFTSKSHPVKLDISCLDCKLCKRRITDLDALKQHLIAEHGKRFADDASDGVLPFKLTEKLSCAVCGRRFPFFQGLNKHMNEHFYLFVCEVCGAGFATEARLVSHSVLHNAATEPCHLCGKAFKLGHRLKLHIQLFHERRGNQKCSHCAERFLDYHQKLKHLAKVHNVQPRSFPCDACSEVFASRRRLTTHTKRDHMLQRNFQCIFCDKKFYSNYVLKNHLVVHSKERNYKCAECGHSYSTKKVLYDHVKRQHAPVKRVQTD